MDGTPSKKAKIDEELSGSAGDSAKCEEDPKDVARAFTMLNDAVQLVAGKVECSIKPLNALASYEKTNYFIESPMESTWAISFANSTSIMVGRLDQAISALTDLKAQLISSQNACKRLTSAVGRLPVEILAEIFTLARTCYVGKPYGYRVNEGLQLSFNVVAVCRRWRSIALSMPRLWNAIYIRGAKDVTEKRLHAPLEMLSRSASVPSFLVVGIQRPHSQFTRKCRKGVYAAFERKCIGLDVCASHKSAKRFKQFEYYTIRDWLRRFQRLERFSLRDCRLGTGISVLSADWGNLTHLHLDLPFDHESSRISAFPMPNLKVFILELASGCYLDPSSFADNFPKLTDFIFLGSVSPQQHDPITHPGVERAIISSANKAAVLDLIFFPSLIDLAIPSVTSEKSVIDFQLRCGTRLRRLSFFNSFFCLGDSDSTTISARAVGDRICRALGLSSMEYSISWEQTRIMREVKARWYEQEYVPRGYW